MASGLGPNLKWRRGGKGEEREGKEGTGWQYPEADGGGDIPGFIRPPKSYWSLSSARRNRKKVSCLLAKGGERRGRCDWGRVVVWTRRSAY